jgi:signal transduction histidine kinase
MKATEQNERKSQAAAETDVTSQQHPVATHERARLARYERDVALRALAGRLAHQIRNPLAAVRAACSGLRAEIEDADQRETLELTLTEIDRMLGFVSATLRAMPHDIETPQAVDIAIELADVIDILASGYAALPAIEFSAGTDQQCNLPRERFRVSVYSLLEDLLVNARSLQRIAVRSPQTGNGRVCIIIDVEHASANDCAFSAGIGVPVHGLQPVGILVAERFARDVGGRLTLTDNGAETQTVTLELPCTHV